jgi:predicted lipoprotein with Yx(FWY)xxD motif
MHAYRQPYQGRRMALRLAGLMMIGMLLLAACSSPAAPAATATNAVPVTGPTATTAATSAATMAATGTTAATTAATMAATGTTAATSAATMAATGTTAATPAATSAATMATTGTPAATSAATMATTGTPSAAMTAPASLALTVKTDPKLGQYLADPKGMTLYTFAKDTNGQSACTGQCAAIWPPLIVASGGQLSVTGGGDSSKFGTITRADGTTQVTYNNQPLYYYAKDKNPGDTTGQGVGSVWFVAKP